MPIVPIDLGTEALKGSDGDNNRVAFGKVNNSFTDVDARAVPAGGSIGQALTKASGTDHDTLWTTPAATVLEAVAGGAGFVNVPVSPATTVELDLGAGRAFHQTMIADIAGLTFANVPAHAAYSAAWSWVLKIDAVGGHTLTVDPALVTFVDGHSFADADMTANAVNEFALWTVGAEVRGALVSNGALSVDPYVLSFPTNGAQLVPITRSETLAFGSVTNVEADGTPGTGTLTFKRDGGADITGNQAFTAGQVLTVTMAGSTTASAVSIPRSV